MSINSKKHSQFELFPGHAGTPSNSPKPKGQLKDLTLAPENIIVFCIIFVMLTVLSYSWGVEQGRGNISGTQVSGESVEAKKEIPVSGLSKSEKNEPIVERTPVKKATPKKKEEILIIPELQREMVDNKNFTIQVASFKLKKNAEIEANRLVKNGYESFVMQKGSYSIVCVGRFERNVQAKNYSAKLDSRYRDYIIRRL